MTASAFARCQSIILMIRTEHQSKSCLVVLLSMCAGDGRETDQSEGCPMPLSRACAQVTAGSADQMVYIWEVASRRLLYKLPGHKGSVNEAVFHPQEPIMASAGSDKQLYLGELVM